MSAQKATTAQFESHLRNIRGTFAAEGMTYARQQSDAEQS